MEDKILLGHNYTGQSAILSAQNANQDVGGKWSWKDARDYFKTQRDIYFANTFRGLGHLMHLVQDMSVPEHVRNNGRYLPWRDYEDS